MAASIKDVNVLLFQASYNPCSVLLLSFVLHVLVSRHERVPTLLNARLLFRQVRSDPLHGRYLGEPALSGLPPVLLPQGFSKVKLHSVFSFTDPIPPVFARPYCLFQHSFSSSFSTLLACSCLP